MRVGVTSLHAPHSVAGQPWRLLWSPRRRTHWGTLCEFWRREMARRYDCSSMAPAAWAAWSGTLPLFFLNTWRRPGSPATGPTRCAGGRCWSWAPAPGPWGSWPRPSGKRWREGRFSVWETDCWLPTGCLRLSRRYFIGQML